MATVTMIDPVTRLEGHLKVEITVDQVNGQQQVVDAKSTGTLFRGFETILKNRNPLDAPDLTQRICGVCPVSHGTAACYALENAAHLTIPENARLMRNLVLGANFIQSHILHFYHLALQDFVAGPAMPPWQPAWTGDGRIQDPLAGELIKNYVAALDMRRKAHEMGSLFGGRLPHPPSFIPGGFTTTPRTDRIAKFKAYAAELTAFITNTYIPDVGTVLEFYPEYSQIGRGYGNLLAFGVFDEDSAGIGKLLRRGRIVQGKGSPLTVDLNSIVEQVSYSWYNDSTNNLKPASGATTPVYPKTNAYSWLKAPRYITAPYEVGPLARMWVNGDYTAGISVNDRHQARAQEALKVAQALPRWADSLISSQAVYNNYTTPVQATGIGLTEAPRGALGHWVNITNSTLSNYQIITPTCWNASPRDSAKQRGPLEQALIGTPVKSTQEPIEVLRVIHSFDPCLSCAVHVMRPKEGTKIFALRAPG
jgi:hydrogenase large subunit